LAVISFFPDSKRNEAFLYFGGQPNLNFRVSSKMKASTHKWLTIDDGDFDQDRDKDIILGAFNRELRNKAVFSSVVILEILFKKQLHQTSINQ